MLLALRPMKGIRSSSLCRSPRDTLCQASLLTMLNTLIASDEDINSVSVMFEPSWLMIAAFVEPWHGRTDPPRSRSDLPRVNFICRQA